MHILDQDAPGLADALRLLEPHARREVLAGACLLAGSKLPACGPETSRLLQALRARRELSLDQARQAMTMASAADDRYFRLREQKAPEHSWQPDFCEARLLRGMAVAFGAAPGEDSGDALYELSRASDNPSELLQWVRSQLPTGASTPL